MLDSFCRSAGHTTVVEIFMLEAFPLQVCYLPEHLLGLRVPFHPSIQLQVVFLPQLLLTLPQLMFANNGSHFIYLFKLLFFRMKDCNICNHLVTYI